MSKLYKRYGNGGDTTKIRVPKLNMAEEIAAINAGKKGFSDVQRDSIAATFDRKSWLHTVDKAGFDTTKIINSKAPINTTIVKRRMGNGGDTRSAVLGNQIGTAAGVGAGVIDAFDGGNDLGYQGKGTVIGKSVLTGAATGAMFGPIGAGVGAVVGGITGIVRAGQQANEQKTLRSRIKTNKFMNDAANSQARIATNPELVTGSQNAQYFADGGQMKAPLTEAYMKGGNAKQLSSTNSELEGNSHEQGGIDVPAVNANLEDGETTAGTFVFSEKLGFAKLHKPIARAIGKIEEKVQTPDRVEAIKRLKAREQELAQKQELYKKLYNIN